MWCEPVMEDGLFVVENAHGRFEYLQARYALVRFNDSSSPWATMYQVSSVGMGSRKGAQTRGVKP